MSGTTETGIGKVCPLEIFMTDIYRNMKLVLPSVFCFTLKVPLRPNSERSKIDLSHTPCLFCSALKITNFPKAFITPYRYSYLFVYISICRGFDVTPITLALSGAAAYPRACQALSSMLSRNALNPADITVVRFLTCCTANHYC